MRVTFQFDNLDGDDVATRGQREVARMCILEALNKPSFYEALGGGDGHARIYDVNGNPIGYAIVEHD